MTWACEKQTVQYLLLKCLFFGSIIPVLSWWWVSLKLLKWYSSPILPWQRIHLLPISFLRSLSVSLVCLPQSSGLCTAQLFSRWSVMIRVLLEAVTLLKCSTAVSSWSTMLKCPQRALEQYSVSWNKLLQIQLLNLFLSTSKQAVSVLLFSQMWHIKRIWASVFTVITPSWKGSTKILQYIFFSHFSRGLN